MQAKTISSAPIIKVFDRSFWISVIIFSILIGIICAFPYWLTRSASSEALNLSDKGGIGDALSGTMSPFIAIAAALLTFIAFWVQFKANQAQTLQFSKQDYDTKVDRFENKFYELLRLHKENVNEIEIDGYDQRKITRRKAFVSMYKEFRYAFFVTKIEYKKLRETNRLQTEYTDEQLLLLAYIFFYAGVGMHSEKVNKAMVGEDFDNQLYEAVNKELETLNRFHKVQSNSDAIPELEIKGLGKAKTAYSYRPFNGHLNRFGHYYRHLYQTVKFVVNQDDKFIDYPAKLEYLKTLRAQLSDHEQVMLYYNAVSGFGKDWIKNNYFTRYKMIHNIPLPLADFGVVPEIKFEKAIKEGLDLFEWAIPERQPCS